MYLVHSRAELSEMMAAGSVKSLHRLSKEMISYHVVSFDLPEVPGKTVPTTPCKPKKASGLEDLEDLLEGSQPSIWLKEIGGTDITNTFTTLPARTEPPQ